MKTTPSWKKPRPRDVIALLLFAYVLNYLVTPVVFGEVELERFYRPHFSKKFDGKLWQASGPIAEGRRGKPNPNYGERYRMVDDLLASKIPPGISDDRVRDLLGKPDGGIVDKTELANFLHHSGTEPTKADKEILESTENLEFWCYDLGSQKQFPASSIWFPFQLFNGERWKLLIKMKNGRVVATEVVQ